MLTDADIKILSDMRERINTLTHTDKKIIKRISKDSGRKFAKTNCNDCYKDELIILLTTNKKDKIMNDCKYKLKNPNGYFYKGVYLHNSTLTDKQAKWFIADHPYNINRFEVLPPKDVKKQEVKEDEDEANKKLLEPEK